MGILINGVETEEPQEKSEGLSEESKKALEHALEQSIILYHSINKKNYSYESIAVEAGKILSGKTAKFYDNEKTNKQIAALVLVGYRNFGVVYIRKILKDYNLSQMVISGLIELLDPQVEEDQ